MLLPTSTEPLHLRRHHTNLLPVQPVTQTRPQPPAAAFTATPPVPSAALVPAASAALAPMAAAAPAAAAPAATASVTAAPQREWLPAPMTCDSGRRPRARPVCPQTPAQVPHLGMAAATGAMHLHVATTAHTGSSWGRPNASRPAERDDSRCDLLAFFLTQLVLAVMCVKQRVKQDPPTSARPWV